MHDFGSNVVSHTLYIHTLCSVGKVVSMYCTYMCVMCMYMCVCACTYMHVERCILTRKGKIVICSLDYLRPFPPPVSTLVCRPGDNYKSRFGQDCVHNYDDVCVSVVKIRDNFFVCMWFWVECDVTTRFLVLCYESFFFCSSFLLLLLLQLLLHCGVNKIV